MESGRVNHSWCMGVVSHSYGGLGGSREEVVVGRHAGQSQDGYVVRREMPEHVPTAR